ncbi:MAG: flagellar motor switch protein FliN [Candidatus Eremiobacteraeota bacterium]|nr:flagellar motor switch protein FliN [Candidatus Eremiobacteraeota bacterium]MBV9264411.1 flagellar motor switch protein FliN [Candidatus Eremiobacteraeota bacterium]
MPDSKGDRAPETVGLLMHVPLRLSVELGTTTMSIADILKVGAGSVIELDRPIDRPVTLLANDRPIARGEIVAVDENFGLRITELVL